MANLSYINKALDCSLHFSHLFGFIERRSKCVSLASASQARKNKKKVEDQKSSIEVGEEEDG